MATQAANGCDIEHVRMNFSHKRLYYMKKKLRQSDCNSSDNWDSPEDECRDAGSLNNKQITRSAIQGLIELINTEMQSDSINPDSVADAFLASTLRYIQFQKQKGGVVGEKFDSLKL
ncbi:hypothetical protein ES319_D13G232700v1 [Gossypium barbadense]|uniref:Uncharacterized protein n=1 Tax=Gossypium barbadense TaxID=3634 RepID=A0A5J5NQ16_GOSBA|nr:hypothetical protein ES319_D13G232700v1 [Gossypium barbadense]